jgi:5-formyltetrahydrofolate cyclo-ligase
LALVPGIGFTPGGGRLGRGKGYYDRFLKSLSHPFLAIGIGFKEQLSLKVLPTNTFDAPLSKLLLF